MLACSGDELTRWRDAIRPATEKLALWTGNDIASVTYTALRGKVGLILQRICKLELKEDKTIAKNSLYFQWNICSAVLTVVRTSLIVMEAHAVIKATVIKQSVRDTNIRKHKFSMSNFIWIYSTSQGELPSFSTTALPSWFFYQHCGSSCIIVCSVTTILARCWDSEPLADLMRRVLHFYIRDSYT